MKKDAHNLTKGRQIHDQLILCSQQSAQNFNDETDKAP